MKISYSKMYPLKTVSTFFTEEERNNKEKEKINLAGECEEHNLFVRQSQKLKN